MERWTLVVLKFTESLAHCMWADGIYDCIEQEGVKCYQPVSDFAVISLPTRFVNKAGSYKCKADGDGIDSIIPCFPEKQGKQNFVHSLCHERF